MLFRRAGRPDAGKADRDGHDEAADAHGERLREHFNDNFFDAVYALNSLDHSREPMHVLQQMLAVVRCGRFVIVGMTANEGVHMGYEGFHQWNFANLRGRLTLHARNTTDVDVLTG